MSLPRRLLAAALLGLASLANAAPPAVVEALALPAWVVRDGMRAPLTPGRALATGEAVVTGRDARALLRLADGSLVRLGAETRFVVTQAAAGEVADPVFRATLRVLTGAFRFTTSLLAKQRVRREIDIQLATATAGIRGTDLWGRTAADRDFIVLIEGRIGVRHGAGTETALDQPLSVFDAPKDAPAPTVGRISRAQLDAYAAETDLRPGAGAMGSDGRWKVTVVSPDNQAAALAAFDRLREAGYPAVIEPAGRGGAVAYHVRLRGLASKADAATLAARLRGDLGYEASVTSR